MFWNIPEYLELSDFVLYARLNRWSNEKMSLYSFLQLLSGNVFSYSDLTLDPLGTQGTWEGGGSRGSFQKLVIWKNVVKQSCSTYFSDDKNAFGVIPRPPRGSRVPLKPLGGHLKILPNQEMLLIKVVPHTSVMTKKQLRVTKPLRRS